MPRYFSGNKYNNQVTIPVKGPDFKRRELWYVRLEGKAKLRDQRTKYDTLLFKVSGSSMVKHGVVRSAPSAARRSAYPIMSVTSDRMLADTQSDPFAKWLSDAGT
jgi:hypothetical protein